MALALSGFSSPSRPRCRRGKVSHGTVVFDRLQRITLGAQRIDRRSDRKSPLTHGSPARSSALLLRSTSLIRAPEPARFFEVPHEIDHDLLASSAWRSGVGQWLHAAELRRRGCLGPAIGSEIGARISGRLGGGVSGACDVDLCDHGVQLAARLATV